MAPDYPETRTAAPQLELTQLLIQWRSGRIGSRERLVEVVYEHLRTLTTRQLKADRPGGELKPTALVHEVYLRLLGAQVAWQDRVHFFAVAAQIMRRVLIEHAKELPRAGRANRIPRLNLGEGVASDVLDLDRALQRLAKLDSRQAELVEMHYFGGLSSQDLAEVLSVSSATVSRELKLAKSWLRDELIPPV